jgi:hypothetical protein
MLVAVAQVSCSIIVLHFSSQILCFPLLLSLFPSLIPVAST